MTRDTDAEVTELVNAAYSCATSPSVSAYRTPHRASQGVARPRLQRLLRALQAMDLTAEAAAEVSARVLGVARADADEARTDADPTNWSWIDLKLHLIDAHGWQPPEDLGGITLRDLQKVHAELAPDCSTAVVP